jgi:hypothetical protein
VTLQFIVRNLQLTFVVVAMAKVAPLYAQAPENILPEETVGFVLGKTVTAADIGLTDPIDTTTKFDARDKARWEFLGRIATVFSQPLVDRFVKEQKLEATAEEMEGFKAVLKQANEKSLRDFEERLAVVTVQLAGSKLSVTKQNELRDERLRLERTIPSLRETAQAAVPDGMAQKVIVDWKTERELHRKYGGRVIFQQFGSEALDGRRRLHEEAERNGDLKFTNAGVRHMFYYYANMKHASSTSEALARPWWLLPTQQ